MVSVSVLLCCACSAGWLNDNTHRHARMNSEKRISRQFSSFVCHCYYRDIWEIIGTFLKLGKLLALKKGLTAPTPNQLHMFYVVVLKSVFFLTFCVFGALQSAWQNQKHNTNSTRKSDARKVQIQILQENLMQGKYSSHITTNSTCFFFSCWRPRPRELCCCRSVGGLPLHICPEGQDLPHTAQGPEQHQQRVAGSCPRVHEEGEAAEGVVCRLSAKHGVLSAKHGVLSARYGLSGGTECLTVWLVSSFKKSWDTMI